MTQRPRVENLSGTLVLVTGAAGFIGSHLVDGLLGLGARVRAIDNFATGLRSNLPASREGFEFREVDIRDLDACRAACEGVSVVFHQAALGSVPRSLAQPALTFAVNVGGTANVFEAARDAGARRVVYASSSSVYGDSERMPKKEGEEGRPLSPYALSKRVDEELADTFGRAYGMTLVGLRYFNVYGPRQRPDGPYAAVIPRFFQATLSGEEPVIYGTGLQSRDFTSVHDAVRANLLGAVAEIAAPASAYNVAGGQAVTVNDIARSIRELLGGGPSPRYAEARAGDVMHSLADLTLSARALSYTPEVSLPEGLRGAREHYEAAVKSSLPGKEAR